jgi:ATP-binding cassette subfamily B protein/ATP-binding cassette subfamily B multidrug efflux pump
MSLSEKLWRKAEGIIDPFGDTDREVLPRDGWRFILYFASQAKGPFALLLVIGGLAGVVDASLYWAVGWLIDLLDASSPKTLIADHWPELLALLLLVLVVRAVIMIANAVVEQQVIVPHFYQMVRGLSSRRVI